MHLPRTCGTIGTVAEDDRPVRVFISYSHDSDVHRERVADLAERLRSEGVDTWIDLYEPHPPEGWPRWMAKQVTESNYVLLVCSPTYRRRFDDEEEPGKGKGVGWEARIVEQTLYDDRGRNTRVIPVLLEGGSDHDIPIVLRSFTHYQLPEGYNELYFRLTGQTVPLPPLGEIRSRKLEPWKLEPWKLEPWKLEPWKLEPPAPDIAGSSWTPGANSLPDAPTTAPTDVAVLIALKEEFRELLAFVGPGAYGVQPNDIYGGDDYVFLVDSGAGRPYKVVAFFMDDMGPSASTQAAERLLSHAPAIIVNVGIACSLDADDLRLCDVVVASQVDGYDEKGKAADNGGEGWSWELGGEVYRATEHVVQLANQIEFSEPKEFEQWQRECGDELKAQAGGSDEQLQELLGLRHLREQPILLKAHLASGVTVAAAKAFKDRVLRRDRNIKALEMEAVGMLRAAQSRKRAVETLVLRGISDLGDASKKAVDAIGDGAIRRVAMRNAVRLLWTLMRTGRLPRAPEGKRATDTVEPASGAVELASAPAKPVSAPAEPASTPAGKGDGVDSLASGPVVSPVSSGPSAPNELSVPSEAEPPGIPGPEFTADVVSEDTASTSPPTPPPRPEVVGEHPEASAMAPASISTELQTAARLVDALAEVLRDQDLAELVLKRAGFPMGRAPVFDTALTFWDRVETACRGGILSGGFEAIVAQAAQLFPDNPVFGKPREEPASPPSPTARERTPAATSGSAAPDRMSSAVPAELREAALESIVAICDDNDELTRSLAEGSGAWADAAKAGGDALASSILAVSSPVELVDATRRAMARLRSHQDGSALADQMICVLEQALPVVSGEWLIVERDGSGRWHTNATYPSTVEVPMAAFDRRSCSRLVDHAPDFADRLPTSSAAIDIETMPRAGARSGTRLADVATALEHRFDDKTLDALATVADASNLAGGGVLFPRGSSLDDRLQIANEAIEHAYRDDDPDQRITIYALVNPKGGHDHGFLQLLRDKLPALAVLVPVSTADRSLNNSLHGALGKLHRTYRSIHEGPHR